MRLILIGFHLYLLLVPAALSAQNVRLQALDYAVYIGGLRAIERARLDLADDDVLRAGCDLIHDVIAVTFINQLADKGGQGLPRILAAGGPPFLDRVEDRF